MTQMIHQTHTDIQVWNVRCEVQRALSHRVTVTLIHCYLLSHGHAEDTHGCPGYHGLRVFSPMECFVTWLRAAPGVVRVVIMSCFSCASNVCRCMGSSCGWIRRDVRLSSLVFQKELQQRPPKCVSDHDKRRFMAS